MGVKVKGSKQLKRQLGNSKTLATKAINSNGGTEIHCPNCGRKIKVKTTSKKCTCGQKIKVNLKS
ncbi:hypothetical protein [Tetragenococcus halophilus]|uniref:hypothetical protein n=1 Tax=Tetragenococcus halophilus TaxID=51669 RepID=UPI00077C678F|nr:hypothetical protein [Tetragenococcus halophilus]